MANQWLRLWHDMPTDPKWRTIARACNQPISLVQAVYLHLLVDASRNVTRGHATVTQEDLASSLDVTEVEISSVLSAMQGRVLEEMRLLGWEARQPKREDAGDESTGAKSAAQRKAEQRERDRLAALEASEQQCHDASRNVTLDKDKEEIKKKKEKDSAPALTIPELVAEGVSDETAAEYLAHRKAKRAKLTARAWDDIKTEIFKAGLTAEQGCRKALARGWTGFEAAWLRDDRSTKHPTGETAWQKSQRERVAEFAPSIARRAPGHATPITIVEEFRDVPAIASR